ncbi:MAG: ABC transporter substrate-binding protein [Deltaproteobacteria bacterium]|jgi:NitT/TauT family transport system substrate-binding protein|nr:ABC transporter substrate-binding protein [Deltaproteobacteria bacterium]
MSRTFYSFVLFLSIFWGTPSYFCAAEDVKVTIGYFPNITHAHALIAQNMTVNGDGWFEQRIPEIHFEWISFNAGPSAMEALFAKAVNVTYVGPNPALNAYIRSGGSGLYVVSGAVRGGAALVVPEGSYSAMPKDFAGKRIATPQLGNTQDIACRNWFLQAGMLVTMTGGDVQIIPTANASIFSLFATGKIDAAWTVEPWVSRLEMEAGGKIVYAEPEESSITTVLVASNDFIDEHPDIVKKFVAAHEELNTWILEHPEEARQRVADELTRQTRRKFPLALVERAWPRLVFNTLINTENFSMALQAAQRANFIKENPDLSGLVIHP